MFSRLSKVVWACAVLALGATLMATEASAGHKVGHSEKYIPGIWVDPDGCEHWAMDDGMEGYMSPNVTRDGIPICHRVQACLVASSDQLFAVDKSYINPANRQRLANFFKAAGATAYSIYGHTDSNASDAYNMGLSMRRANAVADVARSVGVHVSAVRGYGERQPIASNKTSYGRSRNRRVEVICIR